MSNIINILLLNSNYISVYCDNVTWQELYIGVTPLYTSFMWYVSFASSGSTTALLVVSVEYCKNNCVILFYYIEVTDWYKKLGGICWKLYIKQLCFQENYILKICSKTYMKWPKWWKYYKCGYPCIYLHYILVVRGGINWNWLKVIDWIVIKPKKKIFVHNWHTLGD